MTSSRAHSIKPTPPPDATTQERWAMMWPSGQPQVTLGHCEEVSSYDSWAAHLRATLVEDSRMPGVRLHGAGDGSMLKTHADSSDIDDAPFNDPCPVLSLATVHPDARRGAHSCQHGNLFPSCCLLCGQSPSRHTTATQQPRLQDLRVRAGEWSLSGGDTTTPAAATGRHGFDPPPVWDGKSRSRLATVEKDRTVVGSWTPRFLRNDATSVCFGMALRTRLQRWPKR